MSDIIAAIDSAEHTAYSFPKIYPNEHKVPTLSASRIKLARSCARRYYYRYILPYDDRPVERKSLYALRGTALHKAIEEKYMRGSNPATVYQQVMIDTVTEWEAKEYPIDGLDQFSKILKDGKEYLTLIQWDTFKPDVIEHRFVLPWPNEQTPIAMIEGIIDMITVEGRLIDHKSNSKKPNAIELAHDSQFIIYAWAYMMINGFLPLDVVWHHLKTGEVISAGVLENFEKKAIRLGQDIQDIVEMVSYPRRQLDGECKTCPFFSRCYE
jgi:RecB family exonuclease